jgi:hypothetical protein
MSIDTYVRALTWAWLIINILYIVRIFLAVETEKRERLKSLRRLRTNRHEMRKSVRAGEYIPKDAAVYIDGDGKAHRSFHEWRDTPVSMSGSLGYLASVWTQQPDGATVKIEAVKSENIQCGIRKDAETYPINMKTGERMSDDSKEA